jgi:hypothetical protein
MTKDWKCLTLEEGRAALGSTLYSPVLPLVTIRWFINMKVIFNDKTQEQQL